MVAPMRQEARATASTAGVCENFARAWRSGASSYSVPPSNT
eukprot:COSAG01_NODE_23111_length_828_cov_0.865569_2_plen_40_part_01